MVRGFARPSPAPSRALRAEAVRGNTLPVKLDQIATRPVAIEAGSRTWADTTMMPRSERGPDQVGPLPHLAIQPIWPMPRVPIWSGMLECKPANGHGNPPVMALSGPSPRGPSVRVRTESRRPRRHLGT
jgi:hypothetical protein